MKKKNLWKAILSGCLALILVGSMALSVLPGTADAASSSELKQQRDELKETRKKVREEINRLKNLEKENLEGLQDLVEQKNNIDQQISLLYADIYNLDAQIRTCSLMIADQQEELDAAEAALAALNEKNKDRIRAMEEEGELSYWSVLFHASSFADLLDRLNMVGEIAAADQRRLNEISEAAQTVAEAKQSLAEEKTGLEQLREEQTAAWEEMEAKRAQTDALIIEMKQYGDELERMRQENESNSAEIDEQISSVNAAYQAALKAEAAATATTAPPATAPSGGNTSSGPDGNMPTATWLFPLKKYKYISSAFGYRTDPWPSFHDGTDFAAARGTPIYATRSGTVKSYWSDRCGNCVSIDHGDGFVSYYFHMDHYVVYTGATVTAGQQIGYVGSTGTASTGNHLHFCIYYNGTAQNPMDFL